MRPRRYSSGLDLLVSEQGRSGRRCAEARRQAHARVLEQALQLRDAVLALPALLRDLRSTVRSAGLQQVRR